MSIVKGLMSQTQLKDEIICPPQSKSAILTLQNQGNLFKNDFCLFSLLLFLPFL